MSPVLATRPVILTRSANKAIFISIKSAGSVARVSKLVSQGLANSSILLRRTGIVLCNLYICATEMIVFKGQGFEGGPSLYSGIECSVVFFHAVSNSR